MGESVETDNILELGFRARVRACEIELILDALRATGGNQVRAAERLQIPLRTLVYKIAQLELKDQVRALRRDSRRPLAEATRLLKRSSSA